MRSVRTLAAFALFAATSSYGLAQETGPQAVADYSGAQTATPEASRERPYNLRIGLYPGLEWSAYANVPAREFLKEVQDIIETNDGSNDIDCTPNVLLLREEPENYAVELPHVLDSPEAFDKLEEGKYSVYVVEGIEWCGGPAAGGTILGCAAEYGPIVIARRGGNAAIVWAHEIGHAQGLRHFPSWPENVMYPYVLPSMRKLMPDQCKSFHKGQIFPLLAGSGGPNPVPLPSLRLRAVQAVEQGPPPIGSSPDLAFEQMMKATWVHTAPFDQLDALSPQQIEMIRGFIENKQYVYWPNAVLALGYLGAPTDVDLLKKVLDEPSAANADVVQAKINVGRALGWLAQITNSAPAALLLSELMYPQNALKYFDGSPTAAADARAASRQAATGAAYVKNPQLTGAIQHQQNSASRGDINLHVGAGFYQQLYQLQQDVSRAQDTREFLRNSQKNFFER